MSSELPGVASTNLIEAVVERRQPLSEGRRKSRLSLPVRHGGKTARLRTQEYGQRRFTGRGLERTMRHKHRLLFHTDKAIENDDDSDESSGAQANSEIQEVSRGRPDKTNPGNTPFSTSAPACMELQTQPQSLFDALGSGEGDPFFVLPSDLPRRFVDERLYSARSIIADMVSRGPSGATYGKAFAMNIMSSITSSPALFYAMMVGESMYSRAQRRLPQGSPMELEVGARAIRHISQEMRSSVRAVSEANIWAVLTLGYSGRLAPLRVGRRYPRQSFLKELQSIHIYCRMEIVYAHVLGLIQLIKLIGGVHKIKTPGLAQVLSLCGIMGACITLQTPLFPFVAHTELYRLDGRLSVTDEERESTKSTLSCLGSGFRQVQASATFNDMDELNMVIQHLSDFTIVIECFVQGRYMQRTFTTIIDQRNFVQHSLMSLESRPSTLEAGDTPNGSIYECSRFALIIYSFLVIFPLPPITGPLETITEQLTQELLTTHFSSEILPIRKLQLWILVMGVIAATGLPGRSWFLLEIPKVLAEVRVTDWAGMKQILQSFLWHSDTNDPDGEDIWSEVQEAILGES